MMSDRSLKGVVSREGDTFDGESSSLADMVNEKEEINEEKRRKTYIYNVKNVLYGSKSNIIIHFRVQYSSIMSYVCIMCLLLQQSLKGLE